MANNDPERHSIHVFTLVYAAGNALELAEEVPNAIPYT